MFEDLKLIYWPDPRLRRNSEPVRTFDQRLKALAERMLQLMRDHKGVGLAAPQVGHNIRLFVMNPTGEPGDDRVYVNPELFDLEGDEEGEEGCLSLPGLNARIWRGKAAKLRAQDLDGNVIEDIQSGFIPRVWQHEIDHLNGTLITDRMGPVARMAARRILKELEDKFVAQHGALPDKKRA